MNPPDPAETTDALYFEEGNFGQAPDAVPFASPPGWSSRGIGNLFDRTYGNQGAEINAYQTGAPGATTNEIYAGVYWKDGARTIGEVSIGRDATENVSDAATGDWEFWVTADTLVVTPRGPHGEPETVSDEEIAAASWTCVGVAAADPRRNKYEFPGGTVSATAIRIIAETGNWLDEMEVGLELGPQCVPLTEGCPRPFQRLECVDSLDLLESGGPANPPDPAAIDDALYFIEGNFAQAPDRVLFATPSGWSSRPVEGLFDRQYGDQGAGINAYNTGGPGEFSGLVYAGVYWEGGARTIGEVAISRDATEIAAGGTAGTTWEFEVTTDTLVVSPQPHGESDTVLDEEIAAASWTCVGVAPVDPKRNHYEFPGGAVSATAIRIIAATGGWLDEMEVGETLGPHCTSGLDCPRVPCAGGDLDLLETGGPADPPNPAVPDDALHLEEGNFAQAPDAVPFASPPGWSSRPIDGLFDRQYGDQLAGINAYQTGASGATSGAIYAGVYWSGGARTIGEVSIGRDATEVAADGVSGNWQFEVTTDDLDGLAGGGANGTISDEEVAAASWTCVGETTSHINRNKYEFAGGEVSATAIRILASGGNWLDEMEVGLTLEGQCTPGDAGCPRPIPRVVCTDLMDLLDSGGPANPGLPAATNDALFFEEGNYGRAPDAVAFSSPAGWPARPVPLLFDGKYGGQAVGYQTGGSGGTSGLVYAGVYWENGPRTIGEVAISRDATENESNAATGNREFDITTDILDGLDGTDPNGVISDEEVAAATWSCVGFAAADPIRNRYEFPGGDVSATAIRIIAETSDWLDEMEVGEELGPQCVVNSEGCPRCDLAPTSCPWPEPGGGTTYMAAFATPTMDGDLSDWSGLSSDTLHQITLNNDVSGDGGREHDIRFAWDNDNFYVAVEETIVDATPTEGADAADWFSLKPWSTDSVGFYDAPGIFPGPGPGGSTGPVTQYWVGMASDGDAGRHMARLVPEDASGDFLISGQQGVNVVGGRRISEFSMSWADIKFPGFIIEAGARFRHDPLMVDGIMEDGAFHGQSFPGGEDNLPAITPQTMSVVELSACVATEVGTEVTCNDGIDNDCDGDIDTLDSDCPEPGARFLRADTNGDGNVNLPDAQHLLNFLFLGGPVSKCKVSTDANGDGNTNLPDAQYILNFLFLGGPDPKPPFPECAPFVETTMPEIGCETEPVGGACAP